MASSLAPPPVDPDRLHGWKEISAFVGKGLRTVQRWEKQHGLPVRRLGDGSDIVFASRREIDAWLADKSRHGVSPHEAGEAGAGAEDAPSVNTPVDTAPTAPSPTPQPTTGTMVGAASVAPNEVAVVPPEPATSRPAGPLRRDSLLARLRRVSVRTYVFSASAGTLMLAMVSVPWPSNQTATPVERHVTATGAPSKPDKVEVDDYVVRALDARGHELWTHQVGQRLRVAAYAPTEFSKVAVSDIDGDGTREVLLVKHGLAYPDGTALIVFDEDGRVRFEHVSAPTLHFNGEEYGPPYPMEFVFLTEGEQRQQHVWAVSFHAPYFPSLLERLDPSTGAVLSTYVSNGYISSVNRITWKGRPAIAVGAVNNDWNAASLAIFPADRVSGAAPARRKYRCEDCPPGEPEEYFVFPRSCMLEATGGGRFPTPATAQTDGRGNLRVGITQTPNTGGPPGAPAGHITYAFSPDGELIEMDPSEGLVDRHRMMRQAKLLDHDLGAEDERWLSPVLRWDGQRFVEVNRVALRY